MIILAPIVGVSFAISMAFVVKILIGYLSHSTRFEEFFGAGSNYDGAFVSGSATVFSGIIVIAGVIITLRTQWEHAEHERFQKLKSINFSLAGVFDELAGLCGELLHELESKATVQSQKHKLSKQSIKTVRIAIENIKGVECEYLCMVMLYYQIMLNRLGKRMSKNPCLILLISLKSIAEVCVNAAIRGNFDICLDLCKRQFTKNLLEHMEAYYSKMFVEEIAREFDLKYCHCKNIFEGRIGFLEDNYLDRYKLYL